MQLSVITNEKIALDIDKCRSFWLLKTRRWEEVPSTGVVAGVGSVLSSTAASTESRACLDVCAPLSDVSRERLARSG